MKIKSLSFIRTSITILIVLFCIICMILAYYSRSKIVHQLESLTPIANFSGALENRFFDARYNYYLKHNKIEKEKQSDHVALVKIDDEALEKIGRWPWSRTQWVPIFKKLKSYGAKVISFDVIFSEPEKVCEGESPDLAFAKSIQDFNSSGGSVILPYSMAGLGDPEMAEPPGELYEFILGGTIRTPEGLNTDNPNFQESDNTNHLPLRKLNRTTFPIEQLRIDGNSYGFLDTAPDSDGVFRHFPVALNVDYMYLPSLALATATKYTSEPAEFNVDVHGNASLKIGEKNIEASSTGEVRVKFFGDEPSFPHASVVDIIAANDDDPKMIEIFKDKVAFIALTALGNANDIRATPISPGTHGVLMHMNLTQSLITGDAFKPRDESMMYSFAILFVGILIIILGQLLKNPFVDLLVLVVIIIASLAIDTYYFLPKSYELKLFFCLQAFILTYVWNTFLNFYLASKEKKEVRGAFSKMVDKGIVDELLKNPEKLQLGGEKKDITVFFSDVRDFTTISEKLTPEQLTYALNVYMTRMTDILIEHKGTLDKYIGDAIVGYWGAPVEIKDHAYKAILASKEQLEALPEINERFEKENLPLFKVGIGLNSGICSVGNMGSNQIFQYTALGDNMNLGARLEGLCKPYRSKLLISEFTYANLTESQKSDFIIRRMDKVRVKGKENAVEILEVLDNTHILYSHKDIIEAFNEGFELYLNRKFQQSIDLLKKYGEKFDDWSTHNLIEKCERYLQEPPANDWDGVVTFTTK